MTDTGGSTVDVESKLRTAMVELTHKQFDQLCVFLLQEISPESTVDFVIREIDSEIDLVGDVEHPFLELRYGVRLEQLPTSDEVSSTDVRAFAANLRERELHTGVVITTGSISETAADVAATLGVSLIDGDQFANLLVSNELGFEQQDGTVNLDENFWDLFRGQERTDTVPTIEVPQADSIDRLDQTLRAVDAGNHDKDAIADEVSRIADESFDPRQADYYGTAGWLLGFLHKDYASSDTGSRGRWGLTRLGSTYLSHRRAGERDTADEILHRQIRQIEIIQRILTRLEAEGTMRREEITALVGEETELGGTTVSRRTRTLINWLEHLPSVTTSGSGPEQVVQYTAAAEVPTGTESAMEERTADSDQLGTQEEPPRDEDTILDEIVASFEEP